MRIDLINTQITKQQGQPIHGSHYIGITNAIFWREMKIKHDPSCDIPRTIELIRHLKRRLDLIIAFGVE